MIIDACKLPTEHIVETAVCIIGAGPAGITLAREFAGQDVQVCLLESGGLEFNQETQSLCEGETIGDPFQPLHDTRHRQFGGNANRWLIKIGNNQMGVRYVPLDEVDFEKREWLPYSGWPFSKSHLNPFYERAQSVCKIGPFAYDAEAWEDTQTSRLPLIGNRVTTTMFQFGPRDVFTHEYRNEINQAANITTYINANVVEIETDEVARTVTRVRVACKQGKKFWVAAKNFILATGGIEGARLLLLSNEVHKAGLGNQNDLVGRFFMDHPLCYCGTLVPFKPEIFNTTALYDMRRVNNVPVMGKLSLTQELMRHEQLLNISAVLFPRPKSYQLKAVNSLKTLVEDIRHAGMPKDTLKHLSNIMFGIDYIIGAAYLAATKQQSFIHGFGRGGWSEVRNNQRRFKVFEVFHQIEQAPDPANRVMLSAERDRFGSQKVQVHWRLSDTDIRSIKRAQEIFAEEIARAGLGQLQIERDGELPQIISPVGTAHHIGATRMHIDPTQGVVDENCRVHGVSNLFIASSSVFPTGGCANPTLTIVALAIRLADHLKKVMALDSVKLLHSLGVNI